MLNLRIKIIIILTCVFMSGLFLGVSRASASDPIGYLDVANCDSIAGWAFDSDTSSGPIAIHIYEGGAGVGPLIAAITTDGYRPDVNAAFGISGNHGFGTATPSYLKDGYSHTVVVYAIDSWGGNNPEIGRATGTCGSPPPPNPPPPTVTSFYTNPSSIAYGGSSTIFWSSSGNATSCTSPQIGTAGAGGSYPIGPLYSNTTYTITCSNAGGTSPQVTTTISVSAPVPAPVCSATHYNCSSGTAINGSESGTAWTWLCRNSASVDASCSEAKPPPAAPAPVCSSTHYNCSSGTAINGSESSTAWTWLCRNADNVDASCSETKPTGTIQITNNKTAFSYCVKKDGVQIFCDTRSMSFPGHDANHSYSVVPSDQTNYTWTVSPAGAQTLSGGGTVAFNITYTKGKVTTNITCPSGVIPYGGSANVTWSSTNANSCTVSPTGWSGTSGSQSDGPLYGSKTYSITCNP